MKQKVEPVFKITNCGDIPGFKTPTITVPK
jgi:hypothetical protein